MKAPELFQIYNWFIDTIYRSGGITLKELNQLWIKTEASNGIPMSRTTFNRYRDSIEEMFGIIIQCRRKGGYQYYIEKDALESDNLQNWMLDTLSVSNMLRESSSLKDRIILENIPSGKEYLSPIINAMKQSRKLKMTYHKFGQPVGYTITIEPYAIKVFKQRWYLLANDYKRANPSVYALDRIEWLDETEETFDFPADFDTEKFFKDCYGVICGTDKEPQRIVIRAYAPLTNYLRTLPLHHSQKELNTTAEYSDFEFYLRPTFDFLQELLSKGKEVEVLEPASFRQEIIDVLKLVMSRHQ